MVGRGGLESQTPGKRGEIHVDFRSPSCLQTRLVGHFDRAMAERFIATLEDWMGARSSLLAFHDGERLEDYDVGARERVTAWSRTRIARFDAVHLLVQSRSVALGLRLISMVVGAKLVTHHDRAAFMTACARGRSHAPALRR
jgi:hypothetical protein